MSGAKRIALLGAAGTGKTRLAGELAAHLDARGLRAVAVPEVLREWREAAGHPPRPGEHLAIAREQERRADAAAQSADFVIADGSALMVAIAAAIASGEGALYSFALERQRAYDATLVTGLDLPWLADGLQGETAQPREPVDALVRSLLQRAGVAYQVVYGHGPQRLRSALQALETAGVLPAGLAPRPQDDAALGRWVASCEKCSDPECEHRLFSRLREARR